ncbi:MAG TPA: Ppx/GppA phosphatase family protein [Mariprofundaceae bacterium]|nr:Ppx/GppA phosphatase family protein [Mariprofundaceae bacterium]
MPELPLIAAIDVGSNAFRLGIASPGEDGNPKLLIRQREPVRLGHDAFTSGRFSESTMDDAVAAFQSFRRLLDQHGVSRINAIATSAMRDAVNSQELIRRIDHATGVRLQTISGEEEARLVQTSIARRVDLSGKFSLLIDIGGGSVEITLCDDGQVVAAQSLKLGTVRLLEMFSGEKDFTRLLGEYLEGMERKLRELVGERTPELCVATGGNATAIGEMGQKLLGAGSATQIDRKELKQLIKQLSKMSFEERVRDLGLRPDRADVILPAAMVIHEVMQLSGAQQLAMPDASLLDGVLIDMQDNAEITSKSRRNHLIAWAKSLKSKYHVDQQHAATVARLSLSLFDQTLALHKLGLPERLLLEIAALVHEIGMYISVDGHHRHAAYMISVSSLVGLSDDERKILSRIVRYQRKGSPTSDHKDASDLSDSERKTVWQLSALLRMGIALDKERRSRVATVHAVMHDQHLSLQLEGEGDLLLERWACLKTADYFEKAFGKALKIDLATTA